MDGLTILYEDNHLIILNKKCGDIIQGDKTGDEPLSSKVAQYLKEKYKKPGDAFIGVIHRIDRPVSGIVVLARTSKALARMNALFNEKEVKKIYWAIIKGTPPKPKDELIHFLTRNETQNKAYISKTENKNTKRAELEYTLIATSDHYSLLEIELKTGRHHQIRCQLAHIGCPIKGDLKYGFPRSNPDGGISLHSRKIEFIHPVKNTLVTLVASPPDDSLWNAFMKVLKGTV